MDLVLLHALPFDGTMWSGQRHLVAGRTHAPTLYRFGDHLPDWAQGVLRQVDGDRLIVVGNSIGGSCALEMAAQAPQRIAALVLIGTKAGHRPEPTLQQQAVAMLRNQGIATAWSQYWDPLLAPSTSLRLRSEAWRIAERLPTDDIVRGVQAFHTRPAREELLRTLRCPVISIMGEHDGAPGLATMRAQAEAANGQLIIVPDCGHYVPIEQPAALNSIIEALIHELV